MGNGDNIGVSVSANITTVLRIVWTNPQHELLSRDEDSLKKSNIPVVRVVVQDTSKGPTGGVDVDLSSSVSNGQVEFIVPPDWVKLDILLQFAPKFAKRSFREVNGSREMSSNPEEIIQHQVFEVMTSLARGGAEGGPKARPETDQNKPELEHRLYHPHREPPERDAYFIAWPTYLDDSTRSITTLRVEPDLVDVTELWKALSLSDQISVFQNHAARQRETNDYPGPRDEDVWRSLRILARTRSGETNLLAVFIPSEARNPTTQLSTFVMFTPSGYGKYNSIAFVKEPLVTKDNPISGPDMHSQFVWNRYLLKGLRDSSSLRFKDYLTVIKNPETDDNIHVHIPVGFSAAVEKSGKPVVLILPLSQGDTHYPDWEGEHGPLLTRILLLLWKNNHIALTTSTPPDVKRQGLGGFSRAGGALLDALRDRTKPAVTKNRAVSVLCCFDGQGAGSKTRFTDSFDVGAWLSANPKRVFCLTAGLTSYLASNVKQVADLLNTRVATPGKKRVFAHPLDDRFWGGYFWPDPDKPEPTPPDNEVSAPGQVGSWWVRLIRPSSPFDADPFSMTDHASLNRGLFRAPPRRLPIPRPVSYDMAFRLLAGFSVLPTDSLQGTLAHQFAIAGGGKLPTPDGTFVEMSYLQCIFTHWADF